MPIPKAKKAELFAKVRNGTVRVLMGSTQKWEQEPMSRRALWHCTISTARGVLPTLPSATDAWCAKATMGIKGSVYIYLRYRVNF